MWRMDFEWEKLKEEVEKNYKNLVAAPSTSEISAVSTEQKQ